jgi:tetrahydromethanopterin S-methyltransferase subunit F
LLPFITNTHSRRKYYIANYIAVGISSVANVAAAIWCTINVVKYRNQFLTTVDFEALKEYSEKWNTLYTESTFWFDIGFLACALLIIVTALNIYNLIWKTKLMKEEKQLILEGSEG